MPGRPIRATCSILLFGAIVCHAAAAPPRSAPASSVQLAGGQGEQLMARYNTLMAAGRYGEAEQTAVSAAQLAPGRAEFQLAILVARQVSNTVDFANARQLHAAGIVDTIYQVELSAIPTPYWPPMRYPDPQFWQRLPTRRNARIPADMKSWRPPEQKIFRALDEQASLEFTDQPLQLVVEYLDDKYGIQVELDRRELAKAGINGKTPVTFDVKGVTLRSALHLMLRPLDLKYVVHDEVLLITTNEHAATMVEPRVYMVGDLLNRRGPFGLPIRRVAWPVRVPGRSAAGGTLDN